MGIIPGPRAGEGCFSENGRIIQGLISCSCNASFAQSADQDPLRLKLFIRRLRGGGGTSLKHVVTIKDFCFLKGQKAHRVSGKGFVMCAVYFHLKPTANTVHKLSGSHRNISASCNLGRLSFV